MYTVSSYLEIIVVAEKPRDASYHLKISKGDSIWWPESRNIIVVAVWL